MNTNVSTDKSKTKPTVHQWYSVRSIFRLDRTVDGKPERLFEERVVIFRAASSQEALEKGKVEAQRYAEDCRHATLLDHVVAFALWENELCEGEEVWSCLRKSDEPDEHFLNRVYAGELVGLRHAEPGD